jgi:pimeloyl-ACP methyl ester carboxylesterase
MDPGEATDCRFVADIDAGRLDVRHRVVASGQLVDVSIETTRYVGKVFPDGALRHVGAHTERGTLAQTMLLTIRANISARDLGGTLGRDGLDVQVFLHKAMPTRTATLGPLIGSFSAGWETYQLDVDTPDLLFPDDPCLGLDTATLCGNDLQPRPNEISFEFIGNINTGSGLTIEVDWLTLEPKGSTELAWRPALLVHGWRDTAAGMQTGTAWADGLDLRDVAYHVPAVDPRGSFAGNAGQLAAAVTDTRSRFGVERVNVVAHSKGGIDTRQYLKTHNDVENLIMIATPNAGCIAADIAATASAVHKSVTGTAPPAFAEVASMTIRAMAFYNGRCAQNPNTRYVAVAGDYDSFFALVLAVLSTSGANDELVPVSSVTALAYAVPEVYRTSTADAESQGICVSLQLRNHSCLKHNERIMNELFPVYLTPLQPPQPLRFGAAPAAEPVADDAPVLQALTSGAGLVPADGDTVVHTALVDAVDAALFLLFTDGDYARLELVSPTGRRIDAATPQADSAVVHAPPGDAGLFWYTAYHVLAPEAGVWTMEVTGAGGPPEAGYVVSALGQVPPGSGALLTVAVQPQVCAIGDQATASAALTSAGTPVTGASVRALVAYPDGVTTEEVVLVETVAGGGEYAGALSAATQAGRYDVVVTAESALPAFTRQQLVQLDVLPSRTTFTGEVADRGIDDDGDGRYERLAVDVGVEVDVAASYRVFGTLADLAGAPIEQVLVEGQLAAGRQTVSLEFDGAPLFARGTDGPYLVDDLMIEDVASATGLASAEAYTTAAYLHTDFQRPGTVLTGATSDRGTHDLNMDRLPYEALVVEVEVDSLVGAEVEATANLHAQDGTFVAPGRAVVTLPAGPAPLPFVFSATQIFAAGRAGPYELRLLSVWGTTDQGAPVSLRADGAVAVTQAYRLEDFAESPRFTVGGTVTGLIGVGQLELEISAAGPPGTPATFRMRPGNGPFTFALPRLVSGNPYAVRITQQPTNPIQTCTVTNASGTIEDANVTDVEVRCL